jgi:truncated hemoglobin YjbI
MFNTIEQGKIDEVVERFYSKLTKDAYCNVCKEVWIFNILIVETESL